MRALIFDNTVVDLVEKDFDVSPSMTWMDAPDGCEIGWLLEGGKLVTGDKRTDSEKAADELTSLRMVRDSLLSDTDWWALADVTLSTARKEYRQALRDITDTYQSMDADGFKWPTKP
jgi:hypothetical protein